MKALLRRSMISMVVALTSVGCRRDELVAMQVRPIPPAQPLVFYDEKGKPSERTPELSQAEFDRIVSHVTAATSESIWFVRVKPGEGGQRGVIIVYLVPQGQTTRMRQGLARYVWVHGQELGISPPWQYVQISGPSRMFTNQLDLPSASDLPFKRGNTAISEQELIRISDFVRQPSNYEAAAYQHAPPEETKVMIREVQESPLFGITQSDKDIHVEFGYLHGALWGSGIYLELERTATGYRLMNWGFWIS